MQVRDYIAAQNSHPSDNQAPAHGWEVKTQHLPSKSHLDDGPWPELTWDILDLDNDQLWEVLKALHVEVAKREHTVPHMGHPGAVRGRMAKMDDGEMTF